MNFHQLELSKHCRVCGKRLYKAKSVYSCVEHSDSLLKCSGIEVSHDDPAVHPFKFCNPCYAVTRRLAKATATAVHFSYSVLSMEWSSHSEGTCMVRMA